MPTHKINRDKIKQMVVGVDWGFSNPGCFLLFGVDSDKRMILLRQIYQTKRTIDWWLAKASALEKEFGRLVFVCDPSEPAYIQQFVNVGLDARPAFNDISLGVDNVQQRFVIQADGLPRIMLEQGSLLETDPELRAAHKPLCLEDELELYVWPPGKSGKALKEVPVDDNNHAADALRYAAAFLDRLGPDRRLIYA